MFYGLTDFLIDFLLSHPSKTSELRLGLFVSSAVLFVILSQVELSPTPFGRRHLDTSLKFEI